MVTTSQPTIHKYLLITFILSLSCGNHNAQSLTWNELSETLPTTRSGVVVARDVTANLVWIFGGWSTGPVTYSDICLLDTANDTLASQGNLPIDVHADHGQVWTTIDDTIYFVQNISSVEILSFNMTAGKLVANGIGSASLGTVQCMAAYGNTLLIVSDGQNLTIYDLQDGQWIAPSMLPVLNVFREGLTCQVYNHYMYAIGGRDGSELNTIEKLDLTTNATWEMLSNTLSFNAYLLRSTMVGSDIIVTGGFGGASKSDVNVISTLDDSVTVETNLNFGVDRHGIVTTANNEVVIIGGRTNGAGSATTNLISISTPIYPTFDPTHDPTSDPTAFPTMDPTTDPTLNPTPESFSLTHDPSMTTESPTLSPTIPPTVAPSFSPTISPTNSPTWNGTGICADDSAQIMDTTYEFATSIHTCIEPISQFVSDLIEKIDATYDNKYDIYVQSNVTDQYREEMREMSDQEVCGNFSVHIQTCFDSGTNTTLLLAITSSDEFEGEINDLIEGNNTIIYIKTVTIMSEKVIILDTYVFWALIGALVLVCVITIIISIILFKTRRDSEREKQALTMCNPMVILLAIGEYDEEAEPDTELEDAYLTDLYVANDIKNLVQLFGETLNYSIYPWYDIEEGIPLHWKQKDILDLLQRKAEKLSENPEYDGLVVVISSHGIKGHICTSDYKLISKLAIHRLFTTNYAQPREIPRLFIFDGCEGNDEHGGQFAIELHEQLEADPNNMKTETFDTYIQYNEIGKTTRVMQQNTENVQSVELGKIANNVSTQEQSKHFRIEDIVVQKGNVWARGTRPPDFRLAVINAASPGFQSKLNTELGSYLLYEFCQRISEDKFIGEVFDEIQQYLAEEGKQHITATFNDMTRSIRFRKNDNLLGK